MGDTSMSEEEQPPPTLRKHTTRKHTTSKMPAIAEPTSSSPVKKTKTGQLHLVNPFDASPSWMGPPPAVSEPPAVVGEAYAARPEAYAAQPELEQTMSSQAPPTSPASSAPSPPPHTVPGGHLAPHWPVQHADHAPTPAPIPSPPPLPNPALVTLSELEQVMLDELSGATGQSPRELILQALRREHAALIGRPPKV